MPFEVNDVAKYKTTRVNEVGCCSAEARATSFKTESSCFQVKTPFLPLYADLSMISASPMFFLRNFTCKSGLGKLFNSRAWLDPITWQLVWSGADRWIVCVNWYKGDVKHD